MRFGIRRGILARTRESTLKHQQTLALFLSNKNMQESVCARVPFHCKERLNVAYGKEWGLYREIQ